MFATDDRIGNVRCILSEGATAADEEPIGGPTSRGVRERSGAGCGNAETALVRGAN